ncbi:hypothetical protein FRC12_002311 [Ceratobasidium sp. 428]|nr:hypothetical protein FRC12_002311 [Ceratobasidium sp. 428]
MAPQDPLLSHLISRLESDINFLSTHGHIPHSDAQTILGILSRAGSNANPPSINTITSGMREMSMPSTGMPAPYGGAPSPVPPQAPVSYPSTSPAPATPSYNNNNSNANTAPPAFPGGPPMGAPSYGGSSMSPSPSMSALKRPVPPPPPAGSGGIQAKALWDYNLDGQLKDDLTFRSGDIIQIVKEENTDWWTGRLNGKEGMFPSNHVEKLPNTPSYTPSTPSYNPSYGSQPSYGYNEKDQYQPQHQAYGPPATYQQAGPVQQQAPPAEEEKKKGKFGKYGGMMAGSAAGGLGFGAGAAVGSGLINAIF